jgi:hypothetical protein
MQSSGSLRLSCLLLTVAQLNAPAVAQPTSAAAKAGAGIATALSNIPEIDKLRTPVSPAFELLGVTPTAIEKPTTPSAVATSLLSSFVSGNQAILPRQYALDVAPFWLVSHPTLTLTAAARSGGNDGTFRILWSNIEQTFTVGLAAADSAFKGTTTPAVDTSISRLGFSVRFSPVRGHLLQGCIEVVEAPLTAMSAAVSRRIVQIIAKSPALTAEQIEDSTIKIQKEVRKDFADQLADPRRECLATRRGFIVDMAAATIGRYPGQSFDRGRLSAYSGWVTAGYAAENLSALGVLRAGKDGDGDRFLGRSFTDVGARLVGAWDQYALSTEAVNRAVRESAGNDNSWRVTAGFDMKISSKVWLNTSFGHDFKAKDARSLLALANLQWSFGDAAELANR